MNSIRNLLNHATNMICCLFHPGSGCGNQLARYVFTRVKALELGVDFGVVGPENFKGKSFIDLDMGKSVPFPYHIEFPAGKIVVDSEWLLFEEDADDYDWDGVEEIHDNMIIDGEFQGEGYFEDYLDEIRLWLKPTDHALAQYAIWKDAPTCIINFRGGEYVGVKDLFLPQAYWNKAIEEMLIINPTLNFEVHTDDIYTAQQFFPGFPIVHNIADNFISVLTAPYLILSNSSFAILPALLNENVQHIIAPKFHAGYNKYYWQLTQNYYKKFHYIHHHEGV